MNVTPVEDLNTGSMESFQLGMNNLVKWCEDVLPGYRQSGYRVIFNLVGGFKVLQGYMQTLGMFYADETVYIFESSSEILSIPRLPVDFSENVKNVIRDHLQMIRCLSYKDLKAEDCKGIPESMLQFMGGKCGLSPWGTLMFSRFQPELYSEQVLPPMLDSIVISRKALSEAEKLDPQWLVLFNRKIDDLCRYMENGNANVNSLSFRPLASDPIPPSTHEFNLWSTQNGWRAFCHYEDGGRKLVIDSIGPGLGH